MDNGKEGLADSVEGFLIRMYAPLPWEEQRKLIARRDSCDRQEVIDRLFRANAALILKVGIDLYQKWYKERASGERLDSVLSSLIWKFLYVVDRVDPEKGRLTTLFVNSAFHALYSETLRLESPVSVRKRFNRCDVHYLNAFFNRDAQDLTGLDYRPSDDEEPEVICGDREALQLIHEALEELTEDEQTLLSTYWGDLKISDYSVSTGLGRSAVRRARARAVSKLCRRLSYRLDVPEAEIFDKVDRMLKACSRRRV